MSKQKRSKEKKTSKKNTHTETRMFKHYVDSSIQQMKRKKQKKSRLGQVRGDAAGFVRNSCDAAKKSRARDHSIPNPENLTAGSPR